MGLILSGDLELAGPAEQLVVIGEDNGFGISILLVQTVELGLLSWGGVQVLVGRSRVLLVLGCCLAFLGSLLWIIRMNGLSERSLELFEGSVGLGIALALAFSIMPIASLVLAMNGRVTKFLASRRG